MKKLIIGLLALGSFSVFASNCEVEIRDVKEQSAYGAYSITTVDSKDLEDALYGKGYSVVSHSDLVVDLQVKINSARLSFFDVSEKKDLLVFNKNIKASGIRTWAAEELTGNAYDMQNSYSRIKQSMKRRILRKIPQCDSL